MPRALTRPRWSQRLSATFVGAVAAASYRAFIDVVVRAAGFGGMSNEQILFYNVVTGSLAFALAVPFTSRTRRSAGLSIAGLLGMPGMMALYLVLLRLGYGYVSVEAVTSLIGLLFHVCLCVGIARALLGSALGEEP